jgi:hypothetical protein
MDFTGGVGFWLLAVCMGTLWIGSLRDGKPRWISTLYLLGYLVGLGGLAWILT